MIDAPIKIAGEALTLMPERAIFWERRKMLLIADPHFGKSATFRAHRIPIPEGSLRADLERLTQAIARTSAATVVVLGDLLHTAQGREAETLSTVQAWREHHLDLHMMLVRGNHDRHAGDPPDEWRIQCVDAPSAASPFIFSHHPSESANGYVLAGHLHPLARLMSRGKQTLQLPCFWFGTRVAVLPAFSSFTDGRVVHPASTDQLFVVTPQAILPLAPAK